MKCIEIEINKESVKYSQDKQVETIQLWLASMRFNGQISGTQQIIVQKNNHYLIYLNAPEEDSLSHTYASNYVKRRYKDIIANEMEAPTVRSIGKDVVGKPPCKCTRSEFYILYTDFFSMESPVRCGSCFNPVPLYNLPAIDDSGFESLLNWQSTYQAFDQLFINSGIGENFALKQLSGFKSQLSQEGMFLCKQLSDKIKVKIFYHLIQYSTKDDDYIESETCPSCKKYWRLENKLLGKFGAICNDCNFISS